MVTYSGNIQNVSGTSSNVGFFFGGFNGLVNNVQLGWYAQGSGLSNAVVIDINESLQTITIAMPNIFQSGSSYYFTSDRLASPISNICFPSGTPIRTNQGNISIDKIDPSVHTIRNKKIVSVTQTVSIDSYLVCFEKNSIGVNYPSERTIISKNHIIYFRGHPVNAKYFIGVFANVTKVDYNGEILYNILLEDYDKMMVNNLIVETLHPDNIIAKLYSTGYTIEERNEFIIQMNKEIMLEKDVNANLIL